MAPRGRGRGHGRSQGGGRVIGEAQRGLGQRIPIRKLPLRACHADILRNDTGGLGLGQQHGGDGLGGGAAIQRVQPIGLGHTQAGAAGLGGGQGQCWPTAIGGGGQQALRAGDQRGQRAQPFHPGHADGR